MTWEQIAWWCVGVFGLFCLFALAGCLFLEVFGDYEPPERQRKRRQLRAVRELEPLTPVWPEPSDPRRGHP